MRFLIPAAAILGAGAVAALAAMAWLPAPEIVSASRPNPERSGIVVGGIDGPREVRAANFTYPEAAVEYEGKIYVANALGGTIEVIDDGMVTTFFRGGHLSKPNDMEVAPDGLVVSDAGIGALRLISFEGIEIWKVAIPTFGAEGADLFGITSVDKLGDRYLIVGAPVARHEGGSVYSAGPSVLVEYDGETWDILASAESLVGPGASLRDAGYNADGTVSALVGEFFVVLEQEGSVKRASTGKVHGGGILEVEDGWLIGSHTSISHVTRDMQVSHLPLQFANVGDIRRDETGALLVTDTDRQMVFRIEGEKVVDSLGGGMTLKVSDIEVTPDGKLLLLENASPRLIAFDPTSGEASRIAGTGRQVRATGSASTERFSFYHPSGIAVAPDGAVVISEANYRLVRIEGGRVEIFAGDVNGGIPVEGQHRLEARFGALRGLDFDRQGRLLVVDFGNHTVWRINADGAVERVMGTGEPGMWKEGEPALSQPLNRPVGVLVRADGSILIADSYNNTIVEVDADGIVHRFAGVPKRQHYQGFGAYSGDGGPATDAELNTPSRLAEGSDGSIYIIDHFNHAVRRIAPDGTITTVLGGELGNSDDGSRMNLPGAVAVLGDYLYVGDTGNSVVRSVPLETEADL